MKRHLVTLAFMVSVACLVGLHLTPWAHAAEANESTKKDQIISVCDFPGVSASSVGKKIRVRGKMTLHAHGILLSDVQCPDVRVHLKSTPDGPDISLCKRPELVAQFGCPAGAETGPIVTAVGVLRDITEPSNGFLLVEELLDFEKAGHVDVGPGGA